MRHRPALRHIAWPLAARTGDLFAACAAGDGPDARRALADLADGAHPASPHAVLYWACLTVDLQPPRAAPDPKGPVVKLMDLTGAYRPGDPAPRWADRVSLLLEAVGSFDRTAVQLVRTDAARLGDGDAEAMSVLLTLATSAQMLLARRLTRVADHPGRAAGPEAAGELAEQMRQWLRGPQAADCLLRSGLQTALWLSLHAERACEVLGVRVDRSGAADAVWLVSEMVRARLLGRAGAPVLPGASGAVDLLLVAAGIAGALSAGPGRTRAPGAGAVDPGPGLPDDLRAGLRFALLAACATPGDIAGARAGDPVAQRALLEFHARVDRILSDGDDEVALVLTAGLDRIAADAAAHERQVLEATHDTPERPGDGG